MRNGMLSVPPAEVQLLRSLEYKAVAPQASNVLTGIHEVREL